MALYSSTILYHIYMKIHRGLVFLGLFQFTSIHALFSSLQATVSIYMYRCLIKACQPFAIENRINLVFLVSHCS